MRAEAPGPKMDPIDLAFARGKAFYERYKRGEVKLTEEKSDGQTQKPKQLRLSDLNLIQLDPYIG